MVRFIVKRVLQDQNLEKERRDKTQWQNSY